MTRRALHLKDDILDATRAVVLNRGVRSATVNAIAGRSGAPVGSLYHHFGSRDRLLAALWIRAVRRSQSEFLSASQHSDPEQAAVDAAMSLYRFVLEHPQDARLLAAFRREDLLRDARSPGLIRELRELNRPLERATADLASRVFGRATWQTVEQTMVAVIDIPMGLLRRHLLAASPPPSWLGATIDAMVRAAICNSRALSTKNQDARRASSQCNCEAAAKNLSSECQRKGRNHEWK
jgi:AcrR family transcriptional regulator